MEITINSSPYTSPVRFVLRKTSRFGGRSVYLLVPCSHYGDTLRHSLWPSPVTNKTKKKTASTKVEGGSKFKLGKLLHHL